MQQNLSLLGRVLERLELVLKYDTFESDFLFYYTHKRRRIFSCQNVDHWDEFGRWGSFGSAADHPVHEMEK